MVDNGSVQGFRSVSVEDEITNFSIFKKISKEAFWLSLKKLQFECASLCVIFNIWWVAYVDDEGGLAAVLNRSLVRFL